MIKHFLKFLFMFSVLSNCNADTGRFDPVQKYERYIRTLLTTKGWDETKKLCNTKAVRLYQDTDLASFLSIYCGRDIEKNVARLEKRADRNKRLAAIMLGDIYFENIAHLKNMEKALKYYEISAEKTTPQERIYLRIGGIYINGWAGVHDLEKARKAFKTSIKNYPNSGAGYYNLGVVENESKNYRHAKELFETATELGHHIAPFNLAAYYLNETNSLKNIEKARTYLLISSQRGYAKGMFEYSQMLLKESVNNDYPLAALNWLKKSADERYPPANHAYGLYLFKNINSDSNVHSALKYLSFAAEKGDYSAQINLSKVYDILYNNYKGKDKEMYKKKSVYWRNIAESNDSDSSKSVK